VIVEPTVAAHGSLNFNIPLLKACRGCGIRERLFNVTSAFHSGAEGVAIVGNRSTASIRCVTLSAVLIVRANLGHEDFLR